MTDGARQDGLLRGGFSAIEDSYRLLVESITDYAIYMLDPNGIVANWNRGAQRFKGYAADEIVGYHFSRFFTEQDRADGLPARILATAEREERYEGQGWRVRKDGTRFWAHVVVDTIRNDERDVLGFAKITRDISEHRKAEERLYRLAHYDPLTALPNRITLRETLDKAIQSGSGATVLMIDLDGFKEVNDTQGHAAGDIVLKAAGDRLKERIGPLGTVAEGVEREDQRQRLRELGCESAQGLSVRPSDDGTAHYGDHERRTARGPCPLAAFPGETCRRRGRDRRQTRLGASCKS
jgi:PAS domain S-box-containing protein